MVDSNGLAARIKERRTGNALTQAELGKRVNVAQASISQWETGKAVPSKEQIQKIGEILGSLDAEPEGVTEAESQTPLAAWLSRSLSKKDLTVAELAKASNLSSGTVYNLLSGRAQNPEAKTILALV